MFAKQYYTVCRSTSYWIYVKRTRLWTNSKAPVYGRWTVTSIGLPSENGKTRAPKTLKGRALGGISLPTGGQAVLFTRKKIVNFWLPSALFGFWCDFSGHNTLYVYSIPDGFHNALQSDSKNAGQLAYRQAFWRDARQNGPKSGRSTESGNDGDPNRQMTPFGRTKTTSREVSA